MKKPKAPTPTQLRAEVERLRADRNDLIRHATDSQLEAAAARQALHEQRIDHTRAVDRAERAEAAATEIERRRRDAERFADDLTDQNTELRSSLEAVAARLDTVTAQPKPPAPAPVNEHADAHDTIASLGYLLTDLAEARARALRASTSSGGTAAPASTTETELRATLADAMDLLFSDECTFSDATTTALATSVRERAIRLGCGMEEVGE